MKKKNYKIIIKKIENTRKKNNKNWMDLLRLALKLDYKSTTKILSLIYKDDQKISKLAKKLYSLK